MRAWIYILKDERGLYYVGSTIDLTKRIRHHELGHTQTTKRMSNPQLVFFQEVWSLEKARMIERRIKKLKRKDYIEKIVKDGYLKMQ